MITLYVAGLFILAVFSLYALIQSKSNRWLVFILIPLLTTMSLYTWKSVLILQGTPILGLPYGKNVKILWIHNEKPNILLLLRQDDAVFPKYHAVEWTLDNAIKAIEIQGNIENDISVEGTFIQPASNEEGVEVLRNFEEFESYQTSNPKFN
jgi:hypothetical protein